MSCRVETRLASTILGVSSNRLQLVYHVNFNLQRSFDYLHVGFICLHAKSAATQ